MAVNYFTFGGIKSSDYGIYISGEGVFNAPKRDVEKYSIPGRNGDFILDKGRFENIEVRYPVFNYEKNLSDFETKLSNFRNALASKKGYQRLTDTFHTDEYRMAAFVEGVEVIPVKYNTASEFEIVFNCKPQRFLTSGETATAVASGGTITNPTLFDASPLIECKGYGNVSVGDYSFDIINQIIGPIVLADPVSDQNSMYTVLSVFQSELVSAGDVINVESAKFTFLLDCAKDVSAVSASATGAVSSARATIQGKRQIRVDIEFGAKTFSANKGGNSTSLVGGVTVSATATDNTSGSASFTYATLKYENNFDPGDVSMDKVELYVTPSASGFINSPTPTQAIASIGSITVNSTASATTQVLYLDSDLGEAYSVINGQTISRNSSVIGLTELPKLASGSNTFTYDNTITNFKVTPRWWRV